MKSYTPSLFLLGLTLSSASIYAQETQSTPHQAKSLEETVVTSSRSVLPEQPDGKTLIVTEEKSAGKTAKDLLLEMPSISQDQEGNLKLRGSSGIRITINNRPAEMSDLENLPGSALEKIELITSPRANMDAEGKGGVIALKLKQGNGMQPHANFSAGGGYPALWQASEEIGGPLSLLGAWGKNNKWGAYEQYTGRGSQNELTETTMRSGVQNGQKISNNESSGQMHQFRVGLENQQKQNQFNLDFKSSLWLRSTTENQKLYALPSDGTNLTQSDFLRYGFEGILTDVFKLNNPGQEIKLDISTGANQGHRKNTNHSIWADSLNYQNTDYTNKTQMNSKVTRSQVSYTHPSPWGMQNSWELGASGLWRNSKTIETRNYSLQGTPPEYQFNSLTSALWLQIKSKPNVFEYVFGLRAEQDTSGIPELGTRTQNKNLFPSAELKYKSSETSEFKINYNKRIERAPYFALFPNWIYSSALQRMRGNPNVNPEITHLAELNYSFQPTEQKSLSLTAFSSYTTDLLEHVRSLQNDTLSLEFANAGNQSRLGLESNISYDFNSSWNTTLSGSFWCENTATQSEFKTWSGNAKAMLQFKPSSVWVLSANSQYNGPENSGINIREAYVSSDLGATYLFAQKRGTLSLRVKDLPWGNQTQVTSKNQGFQDIIERESPSAVFILQASFRIGAPAKKKENKERMSEEMME